MPTEPTPNPARRRPSQWSNPEFTQSVARLGIVGCAIAYSFSDFCVRNSPSPGNVLISKWVSVLAGVVALLIATWTVRSPSPSIPRRLLGITHDTLAISLAMYLGVDANATFGVVYLVVIVGNGFRYGAPYMGYATVCSMLGFGIVHQYSPYWQDNPTLSFYIAAILMVVPGYMYGLLHSLHKARAELEQRANHDHLTGLMNRAGIEQKILETVTEHPHGHALLYMDLDRFKSVNDNAGHAAGDRLLKDVARVIRRNVRDNDLCARLGGDEFCVLLIECDLETASRSAERIREQVQQYRLAWNGRSYSVGASIGVAASDSVQDGQSLLRLADAACYAAKNQGRNSVHVVKLHQRVTDTGLLRRLPDAG
jgi:diguanylate cyclase (GGDEF)-like protein